METDSGGTEATSLRVSFELIEDRRLVFGD